MVVTYIMLVNFVFFICRSTRPKLTLEILVYLFFSAAFGYVRTYGDDEQRDTEQFCRRLNDSPLFLLLFLCPSAALSQYTFFYGLQYTTATFAITFTNVAPVLTFLIAVLLRCGVVPSFRSPSDPDPGS